MTEQNLAVADDYSTGSCFELYNTGLLPTDAFNIIVKNTEFTNCIGANTGGALSLTAASTSKIVLDLQENIFKYNLAVKGGSVFCENCEIIASSTSFKMF